MPIIQDQHGRIRPLAALLVAVVVLYVGQQFWLKKVRARQTPASAAVPIPSTEGAAPVLETRGERDLRSGRATRAPPAPPYIGLLAEIDVMIHQGKLSEAKEARWAGSEALSDLAVRVNVRRCGTT